MPDRVMTMRAACREWTWPLIALLVSAAMLAMAHAVETFGHLPPCPLCLQQREVYWAAGSLALAALALWRFGAGRGVAIALHVLIGLAFLTGAGIAVFHAGGEWKLWDLPASCTAAPVEGVDLSGLLEGGAPKTKVVSCEDAPFRILGLSMAGYNAMLSVALTLASLWCALQLSRRALRR